MAGVLRTARVHLGTWPLWTMSGRLIAWVLAVVTVAAGVAVTGLTRTAPHLGDALTWLALLACALVSVEAVRRLRHPAGVSKDLLTVWALPVALLLPPVWAVLLPVPLMAYRQLRATRLTVYRRVFSTAAIGLADGAASWVFHDGLRRAGLDLSGGTRVQHSEVLLLAAAAAALGFAVNLLLISISVRLAAPGTTWRELFLDREQRYIDAVEIGLGLVVAASWLLTPLLALPMLLPVLVVQRGLHDAQLRAAARLDAKTGLLNATAWQEETDREITRAHRQRQPLAVLIADIDHFKGVNDTHGHLAGDVALLAVVRALLGGLRPYDQLGRFGGEEFTVVLPGTDHGEASAVAERLRRAVAEAHVVLDGVVVDLTVSIGVAVLGDHGHDLTDLLTAADHALYRAKQAGRNQVSVAR